MNRWPIAALIASGFISGHYLTLRAASGRIGDTLGALLIEACAAIGLLVLFALGARGAAPTTSAGIAWSVASGLCISGAMLMLFRALRLGGPVSATGTMVLGGGVALASLMAPFLFGEAITVRRAIGVLLGVGSLIVLATEES